MPYHDCPTCTCPTPEQERKFMRYSGHTCVWASEKSYNEHQGYLNLPCKQCDLKEKI
jgi:hypothetical protein